jgi:hypothetical protein
MYEARAQLAFERQERRARRRSPLPFAILNQAPASAALGHFRGGKSTQKNRSGD